MNHINDYSIYENLPESLNRKKAKELAQLTDRVLHDFEPNISKVLIYPVIDQLDSDMVNALAIQLHCDFYDFNLPLATRRNLVKTSIAWHRIKGTPAAVEMLTQTIFHDSKVKEWFSYGGRPYFFRMVQDISDGTEDVTRETLARLKKAIWMGKNVRSWLEMLEFIFHTEDTITLIEDAPDIQSLLAFQDWVPYGHRLWVPEHDGSLERGGVAYRDGRFFRDGTLLRDGVIPGEWPIHYGWDALSMDELFLETVLSFFDDVSAGSIIRDGTIERDGKFLHGGNVFPMDFGLFDFSMHQRLEDIIKPPTGDPSGRLDLRFADIVPYGHRWIPMRDGSIERGGIFYRDGEYLRNGAVLHNSLHPGRTWEHGGASDLDMDELFAAAVLSFFDDVSESDIRRNGSIERDGKFLHGGNVFPVDFGLFDFSMRQRIEDDVPGTEGEIKTGASLALSDVVLYGTNPIVCHNGERERGGVGHRDGNAARDGAFIRDGPMLEVQAERGGVKDLEHDHLTIGTRISFEDSTEEIIKHDGTEDRDGEILRGANPMPRDDGIHDVSLEISAEDDAEATDAGGCLSITSSILRYGDYHRDGTIERGSAIYEDDLGGTLSLRLLDRRGAFCRDGTMERMMDGRRIAI